MEPFETPPPPALPPNFPLQRYLPQPTWEPKLNTSARHVAFLGRILSGFSHQWRHVLRSRYNNFTLQKLSSAIIQISSLDFEVKEIVEGRQGMGPIVRHSDLPSWDSFPSRLVDFGSICVVICPHLQHSVTVFREHLNTIRCQFSHRSQEESPCKPRMCLMLTVREVLLYKECDCGQHPIVCTKLERLLNGVDPPSARAIEYLLLLAPSANRLSRLHRFPLEIQDMILQHSSLGPVEAARISCLMSLGSPYNWQHRDHRPIVRQEIFTTRPSGLGVESQIWFGKHLSGVAYK